MKRFFKITGIVVLALLLALVITGFVTYSNKVDRIEERYATLGEEPPVLNFDGLEFRDLNKNGSLDVYEDHRATVEDRVNDLVSQMTLEEKAGAMYITMNSFKKDGTPVDVPFFSTEPLDIMAVMLLPSTSELLVEKKMNSFNIIASSSAEAMAAYNNNIQRLASRSRLGIPVTIATDPRHGAQNNPGAALYTPAFSQWPSSLGLAATRDTVLVRQFGDIARKEYLSVGIRLALHPMADLATEPRWGRSNGTFGEDADLSAQMTKAYVLGFQGDSLGAKSVACMTKHFSGGGPQEDGEDAHFDYGKNQVYPGDNFDYHLIPFEKGAFPAKTAQIMPYYGIPVDQTEENVAFAFNKTIITKMLREKYGFDGVICTDWNIISGSKIGDARAWGVEDLSPLERTKKVLDAGCDQFGGENSPELIVELVESGQISEDRLDISVKRILKDKFILGLFDDPFVDQEKAGSIAGIDAHREMGKMAQAKGTVLLKNEGLLPLEKGSKIYLDGVSDEALFMELGEVVAKPGEADVIIRRINTPYEERDDHFLEKFFHQGRLYYTEEELSGILDLTEQKPTLIVVNLERPAILKEVSESSTALMAEFGLEDEVLARMVFGEIAPEGKLPFELPSSWEAVLEQKEDLPYDSRDPLYEYGHGLDYPKAVISMK